MAVYFNQALIQQNLAKAKAEVEFWEKALAVLSDPRLASLANGSGTASTDPKPIRGELREKVYDLLPEYGQPGIAITEIVSQLEGSGYQFAAKHHGVAVNDALRVLLKDGHAVNAGKKGLAILWTKGRA